ncbi:MAG: hypothetical protein FWD51_03475 [Betaproteobacteria bacterium]|nr:hypothetical protein [Betaproteobacteria bacterium]
MRLLSIFALLFLISLLLNGGLKDRGAPDASDEQEWQDTEELVDMEPTQAEQEDFSSLIFSQPYPVRRFDFAQESVFSIIETEIKNLIVGRNDDSFKTKNYFCAVGYEFPRSQQRNRREPAKREVVVYWKEAKMLYRWTGGDPKAAEQDFYDARSLMYSRSIPLDPSQGVIGAEDAGEEFSDYKERAENVVADCEKYGKAYEIEPFTPPPRGFKRPSEDGVRPRSPPAAPPVPSPAPSIPLTPTASSPLV